MADGNNIVQWVPEQTMRAIVREEIAKALTAIAEDFRDYWAYADTQPDAYDAISAMERVAERMQSE